MCFSPKGLTALFCTYLEPSSFDLLGLIATKLLLSALLDKTFCMRQVQLADNASRQQGNCTAKCVNEPNRQAGRLKQVYEVEFSACLKPTSITSKTRGAAHSFLRGLDSVSEPDADHTACVVALTHAVCAKLEV